MLMKNTVKKQIWIWIIVGLLIFVIGIICGIRVTIYRTSNTLRLLVITDVAESYDSLQRAYRTNDSRLIVWKLHEFDRLLNKVKDYNAVPNTEFIFYKFIINALLLRFALLDDDTENIQQYKADMHHYFDLFSKTRNKPLRKNEMDTFVEQIIKNW